MKLLRLSFLLPFLTPLAAMAQAEGGPCPSSGACHLTRWMPTDLDPLAQFGWAVDVDGDTAVVGAPQDDSVTVYHLVEGQWAEVQRLSIPGASGTAFGEALCLDGDELVVGAPLADVDDGGAYAFREGAAYVYARVGDVWTLTDTLLFSFPTDYARFGTGVDKVGDRIAVGSPSAWFTDVGAVAVFDRDETGWTETAVLGADDTIGLGQSVAIDGTHVLAGDNVNDTLGDYAGRVYAWEDTGAGWTDAEILPAPGIAGGAFLGYSVSAQDGWVAAGAYGAGGTGQVLVYRHDDGTGTYEHETTLTPCGGLPGDWFGASVDLDAGRLVVGAMLQGLPGTPSGRAHVYELQTEPAESWELEVVLAPGDGVAWDIYGRGVAVDGAFVLVGATAVQGSGAAYFTTLQSGLVAGGACPDDALATSTPFGTGKAGSAGVPTLALLSPPAIGEGTTAQLGNALPGALPVLAVGDTETAIPFDGGALYVAAPQVLALPAISGAGTSEFAWPVPNDPTLSGMQLVLQAFFVDPGAAGPYSTAQSPGLRVGLGY